MRMKLTMVMLILKLTAAETLMVEVVGMVVEEMGVAIVVLIVVVVLFLLFLAEQNPHTLRL